MRINIDNFIDVENDSLKRISFWRGVFVSLNPKSQKERIERIVNFLKKEIENISKNTPIQKRVYSFSLAESIIKKYKKNKQFLTKVKELDLLIAAKQKEIWPDLRIESHKFLHPFNEKNFLRWVKYGFPEEIFVQHPSFANFILETHIADAMSCFGDQITLIENQPYILINGSLQHWKEAEDLISVKYHKESQCKRMFQKNGDSFFEYLGGGKGVTVCDRYKNDELPVVTTISEEERNYILELGQTYCRPNEIDMKKEVKDALNLSRQYVLQVVTTEKKTDKIQFSSLFEGPSHPYFRLISPDGSVKTVGYLKFNNKNMLSHGKGVINSPDYADSTISSGDQHITNLAINDKEVKKLEEYIKKIKDNESIFNCRGQNCSSFVKYLLSELELANLPKPYSIARVLLDFFTYGRSNNTPLSQRLIEKKVPANKKTFILLRIAKLGLCILGNILIKIIAIPLGDRPFKKFNDAEQGSKNKLFVFLKWLIEPIDIDFPGQIIAWQQTIEKTERLPKGKKIAISSFNRKISKNEALKTHPVPGFGTRFSTQNNAQKTSLIKKICDILKKTLFYITGAVIVNLIMGRILDVIHPGRCITALHPEMVRHNQQNSPQVGEIITTDARVINSTDQSYLFKLELIRSALQSIDISFNFAGGKHFDDLLKIVEKK